MKKTLALITLAMVAALALCLVGCGNSSNGNTSSAKKHSASEQYILYKEKKYSDWEEFYKKIVKEENWIIGNVLSGRDPSGDEIELFAPIYYIQSENRNVAKKYQNGSLYLFGLDSFRVLVANKGEVNQYKEDEWVKVKGVIDEYEPTQGVIIIPRKDGTPYIEYA